MRIGITVVNDNHLACCPDVLKDMPFNMAMHLVCDRCVLNQTRSSLGWDSCGSLNRRPEPPMHFVIDNFLLEVFSRYLLRSVLGMIHIGSDCSLHLDILFSPLLSMP